MTSLFEENKSRNIDMLLMVEECGICHAIHIYAKANNKYMKDYNKDEKKLFLQYHDANNRYGWECLKHYL